MSRSGFAAGRSIAMALVDVMLSQRRDLAAAMRFFRSAKAVTGAISDRAPRCGEAKNG
jgi:hypothetical protein